MKENRGIAAILVFVFLSVLVYQLVPYHVADIVVDWLGIKGKVSGGMAAVIVLFIVIAIVYLRFREQNGNGHIIVGTVYGEDNAPMEGVTVLVEGTDASARTNDRGLFRLGPVVSSDVVLDLSLAGYEHYQEKTSANRKPIRITYRLVRLPPPPPVTITGALRYRNSSPVPGATIGISGRPHSERTETDEAGHFALKTIETDQLTLEALVDSETIPPKLVTKREFGSPIIWTLTMDPPLIEIHGNITLGGKPVSGAKVYASGRPDTESYITGQYGFYRVIAASWSPWKIFVTLPDGGLHIEQSSSLRPSNTLDIDVPTPEGKGAGPTPEEQTARAGHVVEHYLRNYGGLASKHALVAELDKLSRGSGESLFRSIEMRGWVRASSNGGDFALTQEWWTSKEGRGETNI